MGGGALTVSSGEEEAVPWGSDIYVALASWAVVPDDLQMSTVYLGGADWRLKSLSAVQLGICGTSAAMLPMHGQHDMSC